MSDRINKQLYDDGSVIGYVPKLQYEKDLNETANAVTRTIQGVMFQPGTDMFLYSKTLNGFGQNMPSNAMEALDYAINNMEILIDRLVDKFIDERDSNNNPFASNAGESSKNPTNTVIPTNPLSGSGTSGGGIPSGYTGGDIDINRGGDSRGGTRGTQPNNKWPLYNDPFALRDALDAHDDDYSNRFVDYHKDNIDGSQIPELMQQIHNSETGLRNLKNLIGNTFYAKNNMATVEASMSDQSSINALRRAERSGNSAIINYPMIAYDSILSKSIQMHAYRDNKQAINVANVIVKRDKGTATANDMNIIKEMLKQVNAKLDLRANAYNKNQTIELMQKSLYNYYETRKHLNDLFKLRHEGTSNESVFIGRQIQEYSNRADEALRNVNRVLKLDQLHLKKIAELEKEKFFIKSLYGSTSSNI